MSTAQNTLTVSPSHPAPRPPRRHHTTSPEHDNANDDPNDSDRRRQKRRRVEADSDVAVDPSVDQQPPPAYNQPSILTQISTWEIPPDIVPDNVDAPHPTGAESPQVAHSPNRFLTDQSASATPLDASLPIELSDSDDPTIEFTQTDQTSFGSPAVVHDNPRASSLKVAASMLEPLSVYTCPICFSPPTNAALTPCGHICCGQCLFTAVKSTIRRSILVAMERAPVARYRCPVCRAEIPEWDGRGGGVIGLKMQVMYSL